MDQDVITRAVAELAAEPRLPNYKAIAKRFAVTADVAREIRVRTKIHLMNAERRERLMKASPILRSAAAQGKF